MSFNSSLLIFDAANFRQNFFLRFSVFSPILLSNDSDGTSAKDQSQMDFFSVFMQILFIQLMIPLFADSRSNAWPKLVFSA